MLKNALNFLKKTRSVTATISAALIFFLGYNTYLVDHSLENLKFALSKAENIRTIEDAQKLAPLLDYSLISEITSGRIHPGSFTNIELAKDILTKTKTVSQVNDAKFVLKEVVIRREKQRAWFLFLLDSANKIFLPVTKKFSLIAIQVKVKYIEYRISKEKNKAVLQEQYYKLACLYTQLSKFNLAKLNYRMAISLGPATELARKARFNLAWNDKTRGNLDDSMRQFEELVKTSAKDELDVLSQVQFADVLNKKGDYQRAVDIYEYVVSSGQPGTEISKAVAFKAGYSYLYDLKEYDKAKETFDKLKSISKNEDLGKFIENSVMPSVVAEYRKGGFLPLAEGYRTSSAEKYHEAIKNFDKIIEMSPDDALSFVGKALAYLWLNEPGKALDYASRAVRLLPNNELASVNLVYIYMRLGMYDDAVRESKRLILEIPNSVIGYYNLGYAEVIKGHLENAVVAFGQAIKYNPYFVPAYNNLGWCEWKLKHSASAIEAFEKAVQIDPRFFDAVFNLAVAYNHIGRYEDAAKLFKKVLEIKPDYKAK